MGGMYMMAKPPDSYAEVMTQDVERFKKFYHLMLECGRLFSAVAGRGFFLLERAQR